jgi:hypothetical protein
MTDKHSYLSPTATLHSLSDEDILRTSPTLGGDDPEKDWGPIIPAV